MLDLDALGQAENESWVFAGASCLGPDYRLCLVALSRGGSDAHVVREFDTQAKAFVDGGFSLPEAKSDVEWIDADHIYVGSDFGPGSLTDSGYPRVIKAWRRGTPLAEATTVFEGKAADVSVSVHVDRTPGFERTVFSRALDFYNQERLLLSAEGRLTRLDLPSDVQEQFWGARLLLQPRSDWTIGKQRYPSGTLLLADAAAYLRGERKFQVLFKPTRTRSLASYTVTREHLILAVSENVASRLEEWSFAQVKPTHRKIEAPFPGTLSVGGLYDSELAKDELADRYFVNYADFLTPDTLYIARAGMDTREKLKAREPQFDAGGMKVEQKFAKSKDGTPVPYFVIWPAGAKAMARTRRCSMATAASRSRWRPPIPAAGAWPGTVAAACWCWPTSARRRVRPGLAPGRRQGAQAAQLRRLHRRRAGPDPAQDHLAQAPRHHGRQQGGLLVGATFVQRPDLFNAVVCQVPLLDMRRYHQLLAGASWMAEYGDPDKPSEWAWISKYSPYQNVKPGVKYPKVLFTTSTRDDRVHPGHARKMAALMQAQGHDLLYYENIEGGHGGAADNEQRATMQALEYTFLWQQLGR